MPQKSCGYIKRELSNRDFYLNIPKKPSQRGSCASIGLRKAPSRSSRRGPSERRDNVFLILWVRFLLSDSTPGRWVFPPLFFPEKSLCDASLFDQKGRGRLPQPVEASHPRTGRSSAEAKHSLVIVDFSFDPDLRHLYNTSLQQDLLPSSSKIREPCNGRAEGR